jgi:Raf kinase inhibitor-like YbhB/YbcL family protein
MRFMPMEIRVDGWDEGGEVDERFTCDGEGLSPAVSWSDSPDAAVSFVLWLIDPDAPSGLFTHWLLFNLPPTINALPEWVDSLPEGTQEGTNGFGSLGYGAPCPPKGANHRYQFEIFALDTRLCLSDGVTHRHVFAAMQGHILDRASVTATYERPRGLRRFHGHREERPEL